MIWFIIALEVYPKPAVFKTNPSIGRAERWTSHVTHGKSDICDGCGALERVTSDGNRTSRQLKLKHSKIIASRGALEIKTTRQYCYRVLFYLFFLRGITIRVRSSRRRPFPFGFAAVMDGSHDPACCRAQGQMEEWDEPQGVNRSSGPRYRFVKTRRLILKSVASKPDLLSSLATS